MLLLEAAWRRIVPGVDLADALHAVEDPAGSSPFGSNEASVSPEPSAVARGVPPLSNEYGFEPGEVLDWEVERADTFEWDESTEFDSITDGIGSLSIDPKGTGYMGPQSGSVLLRYLASLAAFFSVPEDDRGSQVESVKSAESVASRDLAASSRFKQCCIDWYFQYFHFAYPILHEGFFRAQYAGKDVRLGIPVA
jgi:transcriptional regulatory protein GAL4